MISVQPSVTVGMPVYNDPAGLRRSVPTVLNQTWDGDVRLLVIDDGSDDETPDVLESLVATYGRIDVIRNPENRGRPRARNQIVESAGGEYLAWLDAGDLWHPRKLELQIAALQAGGAGPDDRLLCTTPLRRHFYDRGAQSVKVPAIAGDQLYNALTGTLYPYLQTMLGPVRVFRELGGFDERLLRRQDYDFLVRFVAEGGRVISTPDEPPLVTYLKSDVGASPATVAAVNRVIRREHAPLYRRYGKELEREVRRNQHLLVGRFYGNNGRPLRAMAYRVRAWLTDPSAALRWTHRALRRATVPLRPVMRPVVRVVTRGLRPVLPLMRRLGITSVARRLGIVRLAAALGVMRIFYREIGSDGATETVPAGSDAAGARARSEGTARDLPAVAKAAERALQRGDHDEAIEKLESLIDGSTGAPDAWLLLEEAYRRAGRLHSAQNALDRALEQHPGHRALEVRLVELHGLRREWTASVERWSELVADGDADLTPLSYARVARSLRMLDEPARAMDVAEEGLERWPQDRRLAEEFHRNRARVVDWSEAVLVSRSAVVHPRERELVGAVTDVGFLAGGEGPIRGWVPTGPSGSPEVSLLVNGRRVVSTYATGIRGPGGTTARAGFSLNCHALLEYVGDGDVVEIETDGVTVPIGNRGVRWVIAPGFDSRSDVLERKLDEGHVFTKFGRLLRGNTPARKQEILGLHDELAEVIEREFDHPVVPLYGNLLGAIRDHDFIGHDVGGFDVGYVSHLTGPDEVREEFLGVCAALARVGYHLELNPWSAYVRQARADSAFVDLHYCWFNPAGEFNLSYGWRHDPVTDPVEFGLHRECPIAGHLVRVPGNAEAVLEQLYGADWAIPIQGFDPGAGITRAPGYLLSEGGMTRLQATYPDSIRIKRVLTNTGDSAGQSA